MTGDEALAAIEVECEAFLKLHPDWYRDGRMIYHPNEMWSVGVTPIDNFDDSYSLCFRGWFRFYGLMNTIIKTTSEPKCGLELALNAIKTRVRHDIRSMQLQLDHVSEPPKEVTEDDGA